MGNGQVRHEPQRRLRTTRVHMTYFVRCECGECSWTVVRRTSTGQVKVNCPACGVFRPGEIAERAALDGK